jgi:hypothetical protein
MSPTLSSMPFSVQQSPTEQERELPPQSPHQQLPPSLESRANHHPVQDERDERNSRGQHHTDRLQLWDLAGDDRNSHHQPTYPESPRQDDVERFITPDSSPQALHFGVDNQWLFVNLAPDGVRVLASAVRPPSAGFETTPSAGSFGDYAFIANMSPPSIVSSTISQLDIASTIDGGTATSFTETAPPTTQLHPQPQQPQQQPAQGDHGVQDGQQYYMGDGMSRPEPSAVLSAPSVTSLDPGGSADHTAFGLAGDLMNDLFTNFNPDAFTINMNMNLSDMDFGVPSEPLPPTDSSPWIPGDAGGNKSREGSVQESISLVDKILVKTSPHSSVRSITSSSSASSEARDDSVTERPDRTPGSGSALHKVKSGKIEKSRRSASVDPANRFVIMTPHSMNAQTGRASRFEGLEAIRPTAKGRKGPLADDTKKSALQVRRLGACFACHNRKVKCDKDRPCKNCRRVAVSIPQILCWQFPDFIPALFPALLRGHFQKDAMAQFMQENIANTLVNGETMPCTISVKSGRTFRTTLTLSAKFFTPQQSSEVTEHWHKRVQGDRIFLNRQQSVPVRIEMDSNSQRDGIKKQIKDYVQNMLAEPSLVDQFTNSFRSTSVPRKVLQIVSNYADRSQSAMVRKALGVYAMHYAMTRHLSFTRQTVVSLSSTGLVPQNVEFVTSRMLNRQVKMLLDEVAQKEVLQLFGSLGKALKEKSKREWAPCLASFLLLCLFMESVETAADSYVVAENEICIRRQAAPAYKRSAALDSNEELENLPFRQFAYQFHQVFQTHTKDATTKPFNPLVDEAPLENGDLEPAAKDMVIMLRALLQGQNWLELDFLTMDPILGETIGQEEHPFPREVANDYQGRLVSKFLLSFQSEKYIFTAKPAI